MSGEVAVDDSSLESLQNNLVQYNDNGGIVGTTTVESGTMVQETEIIETTPIIRQEEDKQSSSPLIISSLNEEIIKNNIESPPLPSPPPPQQEEVAKKSAKSVIIERKEEDVVNSNRRHRLSSGREDWSSKTPTTTTALSIKNTYTNDHEDPSSWSCQQCTYLNIGEAPTCFQCNSAHPYVINADIDSAFRPLKISGLSSSYGHTGRDINIPPSSTFSGGRLYERSCRSSSAAATTTTNSTSVSSSIIGDMGSIDWSGSTESEYNKWACGYCTYENWPASVSCVMCLNVRGSGDARGNCSSSGIQDPININNNRENNIIVENNRLLSESIANSSYTVRLRNRKVEAETRWLEACRGVVNGNSAPIEEYLARGGDPTRSLTIEEVAHLNRPSSFDVGYTLVHLALRFQQKDILQSLLSHLDGGSNSSATVKRCPSYVAPDLDHDIRNHVMGTIRYGKGSFRCNYSTEIATFTLPSDIEDLSSDTQEILYDEILDRDVQKELESGQFINWSVELTEQLNSRLYALWNRSAGDCLLDSVLQATWGIFDKDNALRKALATSLRESASLFYQRWRENEILLSHMLDFSLNENQCATDWNNLLSISGQPGSSLEQLHIFALAHIFRRPIIVYSVKFVKSYLGETLGYARYEGVYLPFLWEASQCWKCPIALGYTRGHFSALVAITDDSSQMTDFKELRQPDCDPLSCRDQSAAQLDGDGMSRCNSSCTYLPLQSVDGNLLPIHYLSQSEVGSEEEVLRQWLDLSYTNTGILVARQRIQKRPLLVAQLVEEWLNHYRTLGQMASTPYMRGTAATCYSSDGGDSDNDEN